MRRIRLFAEGPHLDVGARPVQAIKELLAVLLDLEAELRLEAVDGFVTDQGEILARLRHLDLDGGDGTVAGLRGAEEGLAAEEGVGEGGDKVVLSQRLALQPPGMATWNSSASATIMVSEIALTGCPGLR